LCNFPEFHLGASATAREGNRCRSYNIRNEHAISWFPSTKTGQMAAAASCCIGSIKRVINNDGPDTRPVGRLSLCAQRFIEQSFDAGRNAVSRILREKVGPHCGCGPGENRLVTQT
jgi:hypothetical protein